MLNKADKDNYLVERARKGDLNAFSTLVEKHKNSSLSLACSIIKDKAAAQDILQDVFIKVFKSLGRFKMDSKFSTWLYRIVVNQAYNHLKKESKYKLKDLEEGDSEEFYEATSTFNLQQIDQKRFINLALERLNPDEALCLRMFYLYEMKIPEIMEVTDFSNSKVKVNLHRGRKNIEFQLRRLLGNEQNDLL